MKGYFYWIACLLDNDIEYSSGLQDINGFNAKVKCICIIVFYHKGYYVYATKRKILLSERKCAPEIVWMIINNIQSAPRNNKENEPLAEISI